MAGDHKTADKLKSRTTSDTFQIERKGAAISQIPNRLHILMTTNHDHAVPAGVGARRFVVYDVSDEHACDETWFDPLYRDMNDGGAEEFLYLLQNLKLGDWHPRQILKTSETIEQQRMSGDSVTQWAQACIDADFIVGAELKFKVKAFSLGQAIPSETLRTAYTGFCREHRISAMNKTNFGKACAAMFGPRKRLAWREVLAGAQTTEFYEVEEVDKLPPAELDTRETHRPWGYEVPDGDTWQKKIDERLGITTAPGGGQKGETDE